ncbi:unnamed protein product [Bursaphelenchus okinawaensis]|uniref:Uncharacterized protein n=1 Tax=Bursaphelenchus okinawaensis TaxID=465554 RepID=A0A811LP28_9BILA|nr:unnamed protein product [Bursaphelenchus okinawaensis]CAG9127447.1 unnamed protein product [Bursaphelenchus okinawaensis]
MHGYSLRPNSNASNNKTPNQQERRNGVDRNHQPFEIRSAYDEHDDYLDSPRLFPVNGRQAGFGYKPQLQSVGEIYNDTSSGYSTASGASSSVPSTNTYWARKDNNDFEFVPIREQPKTPNLAGPEWRKNPNSETYDPPSINELVNTLENFDPEPLLQRAVKAQQKVEELTKSLPQRRPNTVLGEPYYNSESRVFPSFARKSSNGNVDFNDFPSNRRDSKRFPGLSTATVSADTSKPTDCSISNSTHNLLNVDTRPNLQTRNIDVSQLDSVLQSPSSGSEHPNRLHSSTSFDPDNFFNSADEWRDSFYKMRDRFGRDRDENGTNRSQFGRAPSLLSKSTSQGNLGYPNSDTETNSTDGNYSDWSRPRNSLANFWLDTLRNHVDTPPAFQRAFSPRLSASERLEQLHEPLDDLDSHTVYRRPNAVDNVASRRAQYLKEAFRSHSPLVGNNFNGTSATHDPNFSELDNAVGEINDRSGCGRFPTNEVKYTTTTTNPDGSTTRSYFGQTRFTMPNGESRTVVTTRSTTNQHSPSPDTLSDASQQSLLFLPHPRPKHNIREQLMNAGVNNFFSQSGFPSRRLFSNAQFSSPNFPSPTTGGVASRVSALEKRSNGSPNLLQLACVLNGSTPECGAPMSPRSTVFRRKPVIHVDYGDEDGDIFKFPDRNSPVGYFEKF